MKEAMRDSWGAYVLYAWGQDELMPISGQGNRAFCDTGQLPQLTMAAAQNPALTRKFAAWQHAPLCLPCPYMENAEVRSCGCCHKMCSLGMGRSHPAYDMC